MDERLRPEERLHHSSEFQHVFQGGRCFHTPCLRIHYCANGRGSSRLGLVVSRRLGKANRRNRIKRLLREVYRKQKHGLLVPVDVVLVAQGRPQAHAEYLKAFAAFLRRVEGARKGAGT